MRNCASIQVPNEFLRLINYARLGPFWRLWNWTARDFLNGPSDPQCFVRNRGAHWISQQSRILYGLLLGIFRFIAHQWRRGRAFRLMYFRRPPFTSLDAFDREDAKAAVWRARRWP